MEISIFIEYSHCFFVVPFWIRILFAVAVALMLEAAGGTLPCWPWHTWSRNRLCSKGHCHCPLPVLEGAKASIVGRDFGLKSHNFLVVSLYSRDQAIAICSDQCHYFLQLNDEVSAVMNPTLLSVWSCGFSSSSGRFMLNYVTEVVIAQCPYVLDVLMKKGRTDKTSNLLQSSWARSESAFWKHTRW